MIQGAPLKMAGSAASIPDASLPHMGWPPTRSTPDADAQSMTAALVLAMSVTTLAAVLPASRLNTSRMARTGAAITTTSAMSTMLRSEWATSTIRRSTAFLTTAGSRSLPTIVCPLSCSASANDDPMTPRPNTATVGTSGAAPRSAARFAASATGAKERVARGGAHRDARRRVTGPLTQASAAKPPGRLGREDAKNFGAATLTTLSELFGHRAEQAPEVGHQPVESREVE